MAKHRHRDPDRLQAQQRRLLRGAGARERPRVDVDDSDAAVRLGSLREAFDEALRQLRGDERDLECAGRRPGALPEEVRDRRVARRLRGREQLERAPPVTGSPASTS